MVKQQSGFTLIELIAVIVILGILAATAVPRFVDLSSAAEQAALDGVAGSIESASSLNYAVFLADQAGLTNNGFEAVDNCDDGDALLVGGALPDGYAITAGATGAAGASTVCTLTLTGSTATASFSIIDTTP